MRGQCLCAELGAGGQESQEQPGEQCRRSSGAHVRAADGRAVSGRNDPPSHGGELGGRPCVEITWLAEEAQGLTQEERDVVLLSHMSRRAAVLPSSKRNYISELKYWDSYLQTSSAGQQRWQRRGKSF